MELRKAHAANDAAVLKAYGWPTDLSEPEIVSRLFDMYAKLTEGQCIRGILWMQGHCAADLKRR